MKKFLGVICLIYSSLIIFVWLSGNLNNYIAPNMQIYIKGSIIPLTVIGLVLLINNKINYKFKISDLVLLLPLILILFCGDGNLSIDVAKVKATAKNRTKTEEQETKEETIIDVETKKEEIKEEQKEEQKDVEEAITKEDPIVKNTINDFFFEIKESNYSYLADYLTYMKGAQKYIGKTIKAKGFAVDYSDYLTDGYFAFGRYMITCCAADAEFTGFMVKYPKEKIEYGKWYEVEGYLELGKDSEGYDVMTINPTSVKEVSKGDSNNNVYSCDTYGKDACEELQKYDLEY